MTANGCWVAAQLLRPRRRFWMKRWRPNFSVPRRRPGSRRVSVKTIQNLRCFASPWTPAFAGEQRRECARMFTVTSIDRHGRRCAQEPSKVAKVTLCRCNLWGICRANAGYPAADSGARRNLYADDMKEPIRTKQVKSYIGSFFLCGGGRTGGGIKIPLWAESARCHGGKVRSRPPGALIVFGRSS